MNSYRMTICHIDDQSAGSLVEGDIHGESSVQAFEEYARAGGYLPGHPCAVIIQDKFSGVSIRLEVVGP